MSNYIILLKEVIKTDFGNYQLDHSVWLYCDNYLSETFDLYKHPNYFPLIISTKEVLIVPVPKQLHRNINILMNAIIKMGKMLALLRTLYTEVIMQVIELYRRNTTSWCWKATGIESGSSDTSFDRKKGSTYTH